MAGATRLHPRAARVRAEPARRCAAPARIVRSTRNAYVGPHARMPLPHPRVRETHARVRPTEVDRTEDPRLRAADPRLRPHRPRPAPPAPRAATRNARLGTGIPFRQSTTPTRLHETHASLRKIRAGSWRSPAEYAQRHGNECAGERVALLRRHGLRDLELRRAYPALPSFAGGTSVRVGEVSVLAERQERLWLDLVVEEVGERSRLHSQRLSEGCG